MPAAFPADRYEQMAAKSPFALATPVVAAPPQQAGYATSWFLTSVTRDPQGVESATIKSQDGSVHVTLSAHEPYADQNSPAFGVTLESISWSDTFRESTAQIKKGNEPAKLIFSKEETVAIAPQPGGPKPLLPGQQPQPVLNRPGMPGANPAQGIQPRINLPRPSTAPVVSPPPPVTGNGAQPAAGQDRRRIRNIAAPQ